MCASEYTYVSDAPERDTALDQGLAVKEKAGLLRFHSLNRGGNQR